MSADDRRLLVIAVGAACWAGASAVNKWLLQRESGWFNYAPNNGVTFSPSFGWIVREFAVWLVAISAWFVISRRLLRGSDLDR